MRRALFLLPTIVLHCNLVVGEYKVTNPEAGDEFSEGSTPDGFHDVTDPGFWQTFDVAGVIPGAGGFTGGAFDGRYVYFAPLGLGVVSGNVVRYDTTKAFNDGTAWQSFDMKTIDPNAAGYSGAVFAKGAVYFVPSQGATTANGLVMRYDTTGTFTSMLSWAKFDATTVNMGAKGFFGAVFDGQYITLVPTYDGTGPNGLLLRYDTTRIFTQTPSWNVFDLKSVNVNLTGFSGGVWDGNNAYYTPILSLALRFKANAPNPLLVLSQYDTTNVSMRARSFLGCGLDRGHVYYAPASDSLVVRTNTTATFDDLASWDAFDFASITTARGYSGVAIDGRYVYFAPYRRATMGPRHGNLLRYDATGEFSMAGSWQTFDTLGLSPPAGGFEGAIFDGKYVYFVPHLDGVVARFDAKVLKGPLPTGYSGSFL